MKYFYPVPIRLAVSLSLPLFCLTAGAAERVPPASTAVSLPASQACAPSESVDAENRALEAAESALVAARQAGDGRREAEALTLRAQVLARLDRIREAAAGWAEAEKAWERQGDLARRIEALVGGSLVSGDRVETQRLVQRASELSASAPTHSLATAEALKAGAAAFEGRGDHSSGRRLFEASLQIHRRIRPESIEVAEHLDRIANLTHHLGDHPAAEAMHHEALRIWERVAPEGRDRAQSLLLLASVERKLGKFDAVEQHATEAADLLSRVSLGSPLHLTALRTQALVMAERGDFEEGRKRLLRVLTMASGPEFAGERVQTLEALGVLAEGRRSIDEARDYYFSAIGLLRERSPGSPHLANLQRSYGRSLNRLGRHAEAQASFSKALAIFERTSPGSPLVAHTLREMGEMAMAVKDRDGARVLYLRALDLYRKQSPESFETAQLLGRLGAIAFDDGDYGRADSLLAESEQMFEANRFHPTEHAQVLIAQGWLAERTGDLDAADARYRRAKTIVQAEGNNPTLVAQLEQGQGVLASRRMQFAAAERHYRAALELRERFMPDPLAVGTEMANLGGMFLKQKRFAEAEHWFGKAWSVLRTELGTVQDAQTLGRLGAERQWIAGGLAEAYGRRQKPWEALVVVEQARARALAALLSDQRSLDATLKPELAQLLAQAVQERDRAQNELSQRSQELLRAEARVEQDATDADARDRRLQAAVDFEAARQEFVLQRTAVSRLTAGSGRLHSSFAGGGPDAERIHAAIRRLPVDSLYLAYQMSPIGMLLIAVERRNPLTAAPGGHRTDTLVTVFSLEQDEPQLVQQVARYEQAMSAASGEAVPIGKALADTLFPKGVRAALARARRVVISPEGPLWSVPFAALPVPAGAGTPGFLGLSRSLTLASSLSLFDQGSRGNPRGRPGVRPEVLVVGDPVFDRTRRPEERLALATGQRAFLFADGRPPAPLPGTREDALAVAKAYGAVPLLGEQATEAAVRRKLPQAEIVHLATHGYLNPRWALASGVLLTEPPSPSGNAARRAPGGDTGRVDGTRSAVPEAAAVSGRASSPGDDGALQAWEIVSQLKLRADLVVLAACETGRGEYLRGEGLQGLTRSLHVAGARSVVASLWKVRDDSTRVLMERFHRGIRAGLPKDEALRVAMAEVSRQKGWGHPFYWAGFVLTGDRENRLFVVPGRPAGVKR